jgi:type I restriction enzyme S subunit
MTSLLSNETKIIEHLKHRGWTIAKIGEIAEKINPGFPSGKHNKNSLGIPHIRPMNIDTKGRINLSNVKYIQTNFYDKLLKDDVLFNNTNSPELLGKTTCINKDTNWAYSNHMTRIRFNTKFIVSAWIAYFLHTLFLQGYFKMNCTHHVNQASINSTFLSKISIPLPPLNEQKRIVSKLEELFTKLDAGIEYLKKNQILLKHYRQSVLKNAFEGKLTEKWRKTNNIKSNNNITIQIKNNETSFLPKSWKWISLNDICQRITDGEHFRPKTKANGVAFLSAKDITDTGVLFDDVLYVDENDATKFRKRCNPEFGDILIVSRGATIGRTTIVNTSKIFCLLGSVILLKLSKIVNNKFINYMIKSPYCHKKLINLSGSTAQQAIYLRDIKNVLIPLPSIEEQKIISDTLDSIFSIYENMINNIKIMVEQANNLRKGLLQNAFEGKLVPQDPNDEPAEILLEKIKRETESTNLISKEKKSKIFKSKCIDNDSKQMRLM